MTATCGCRQRVIFNDVTFWSNRPVPALYSTVDTHLLTSRVISSCWFPSGLASPSADWTREVGRGFRRGVGETFYNPSQKFLNHKKSTADSYHRKHCFLQFQHSIILKPAPSTLKVISGFFFSILHARTCSAFFLN